MKSVRVVYDNNELKLFVKDVRYLNGLVCVKMYLDVLVIYKELKLNVHHLFNEVAG